MTYRQVNDAMNSLDVPLHLRPLVEELGEIDPAGTYLYECTACGAFGDQTYKCCKAPAWHSIDIVTENSASRVTFRALDRPGRAGV